jgi:hypothetical protein
MNLYKIKIRAKDGGIFPDDVLVAGIKDVRIKSITLELISNKTFNEIKDLLVDEDESEIILESIQTNYSP